MFVAGVVELFAAAVSKTEIGRGFNQRPSSALARSISTTDSSKSLMIRL